MPECDLLLIAGDICPADESTARFFLHDLLVPWLRRQAVGEIVAIAGNHDRLAFRDPKRMRRLPWIYLEHESVTVQGLLIWGSPWIAGIPMIWPFTLPEARLAQLWARVPRQTDILLVHGPPHGYLDATRDREHLGSKDLLERVLGLPQLKLLCCGHIHEGYGQGTLPNGSAIVNGSLCDERYTLVNPPIVIDL